MTTLEESYRHCERLSRRSASSFYWSFWLLPKQKRQSMYALYAFSRRSDDLVDDESNELEARRQAIENWRRDFELAAAGIAFNDPLLPAVSDTMQRFHVPKSLLLDILDGVEMDLDTPRFDDYPALRCYCRRVASAVGVACLHIWGFDDANEQVREAADACGIAFQLTNILRDLKEDAERGRCYLPLAEIAEYGCDEQTIRDADLNDGFRRLMRFQLQRANQLFQQAEQVRPHIHRDGKRMFGMMLDTYRAILNKIERRDGDVFSERIRLGAVERLTIAGRSMFS